MLKETDTNVKPIGNGLVKPVTSPLRINDASPLIGTQGRLFSHIGDACCYLICVSVSYPFDTTRSLSAKARPLLFHNTHSLSSEGHSLDLCAQMSLRPYPVHRRQLRAL
jgi:hypothetical protein